MGAQPQHQTDRLLAVAVTGRYIWARKDAGRVGGGLGPHREWDLAVASTAGSNALPQAWPPDKSAAQFSSNKISGRDLRNPIAGAGATAASKGAGKLRIWLSPS